MNSSSTELQAFLFRALNVNRATNVTEAIRNADRPSTIANFSEASRAQAGFMGDVYELLYCLENSIRELIESTLRDALGAETWWSIGVDPTIRKSAERRRDDDARSRWHGPRGNSLLSYVDFPQYADIILSQWPHFEGLLGDQAWVKYYFEELNRTRRALAHTGRLTEADVERMEVRVRDWLRVVG
ncbi:Swt1 family HEPN domain-containing protein [Yonghaparkia sp. Root332]|uniref:Swt1 family HEPN domain-containing protein n=1 Tax=Yonghaparkia sp. Root332 TaxID=1736516 RepID=UPI00138EDFE0